MMRQTAGLLDVPLDRLYAATAADAEARTLGAYESVEQQFEMLYERLRVAPDAERRAAAVRAYTEVQRSRVVPRDGVLDTLRRLGELGLKRGLISNASQVIVDLWPHTAFPPHFENATRRERRAHRRRASRHARRAYRAGYDDRTALGNARQAWGGDAITSIRDVLSLVEE